MVAYTLDKFQRNINGDSFNQWKTVTVHEFPDGVEVFVDTNYETCQDLSFYNEVEKSARGEGDREASISRAARRAKTQVRRRCKAIQADCMVTLTTRENIQDYARFGGFIKAFVKRVRALGDFEYVLCLERQERGALHAHIACQKFPAYLKNAQGVRVKSFKLLLAIWRRVVGQDNGAVRVSMPRGRNSAHRIASYIAKYVSKALEDAVFNAKSYWSSKGIVMPKPIRMMFSKDVSDWDLISLVFHDICKRGFLDIAQHHDKFNSFYWFAASRPRPI